MRLRYIAVPILFGAYPVLALLAHNASQMSLSDGVRSLLLSISFAVVLLLLTRLLTRQWGRAVLLTCGLLLLFFTYGQFYTFTKAWTIAGLAIGRHRLLLPLWGLLLASWVVFVMRKVHRSDQAISVLLVVGAALVIMPSYSLARQEFIGWRNSIAEARAASTPTSTIGLQSSTDLPDIYYVILDAYGRSDVLKQGYSADNSGFIHFLESRGFFVASQARSNYPQTSLSLASSLNMTYLDDLATRMDETCTNRGPLIGMVRHSLVRKQLESLGYKIAAFESGYSETELMDASTYLTPRYDQMAVMDVATRVMTINEFEQLLAKTTILRPILDSYVQSHNADLGQLSYLFQKHRMRILYTLSTLPIEARQTGPKFVFAHIISPHPPFVFGSQGEAIPQTQLFQLCDFCYPPAEYIPHYAAQVTFLDSQLEVAIDKILANSERPPIIIIQGDHGPAAHMNPESASKTNMWERFSILDAYLFPGGKGDLYSSITPVNSFRIVFNTYFGGQYSLLPDESYFAPYDCPFNMTNETARAISGG